MSRVYTFSVSRLDGLPWPRMTGQPVGSWEAGGVNAGWPGRCRLTISPFSIIQIGSLAMEQPRLVQPLESWVLLYPPPNPPPQRGQAWLAWLVILSLLVVVIINQHRRGAKLEEKLGEEEDLSTGLVQMQARYLVGANQLVSQKDTGLLLEQVRELYATSPVQRLRFVCLAGELGGAPQALVELALVEDWLEAQKKGRPGEIEAVHLLRRLFEDYANLQFDAPGLTSAERQRLRSLLGWPAELALAPAGAELETKGIGAIAGAGARVSLLWARPPDPAARKEALKPAIRTALGLVATAGVAVCLGLAGLIVLGIWLVLLATKKLRGGLEPAAGRSAIYAETFAVWMALFLLLEELVGRLLSPPLLGQVLGTFLSLSALGWPVLRGIKWQEVRQDIGLTAGRIPTAEPFIGLVVYLMSLPLVLVGLIITVILMMLLRALNPGLLLAQGPPLGPMPHPIVEQLRQGGPLDILLIYVVASVAAPVVEEIMFRGVLYRHVRDATTRMGRVASVILSALVVSFLFAALHPQGIFGVPLLMSLALGFTLAREWRGTLIPAIVAHGISNAVVMTVGLLLLRE